MSTKQRWLWEEQVFTIAKTKEQHDYMDRRLRETLGLTKRPIRIQDDNIDNVMRGRREPMVIFYHHEESVAGWLNYMNSMTRGGVTALRIL